MDIRMSLPFLIAAETTTANGSGIDWWLTVANYSVATAMLAWFIWRDNRDSKTRETQHKENLEAQRAIESAFRTNTESVIVGIAAMKNVDQGYSELLAQIGKQNDRK